MRSGRLRNRLILQSKTETQSNTGGVTIGWSTQDTVWGGIEPLSGKEILALKQVQNESSVRIVMRYQPNIDETWRIVNDGRSFSIVSMTNENDRDRKLEILCLQGAKEEGTLPSEGTTNVVNSGILVVNSGTQVVHTP